MRPQTAKIKKENFLFLCFNIKIAISFLIITHKLLLNLDEHADL
jgi:hypothetical protein